MEFTDYMWLKLIAVAALAFWVGINGGFHR